VEPIASPQKGVSLKSGDIFIFNKYAGTEIKIDGEEYLLARESDLFPYVKIDPTGIELKAPELTIPVALPPILTPNSDEVSILIADDVAGQLFASMTRAGRFQTFSESAGGTLGDFLPTDVSFYTNNGATLGCRVGFNGLEVYGGSVDLLDGTNLTVTGTLNLSGGTLNLDSSSLIVGGDLTVNNADKISLVANDAIKLVTGPASIVTKASGDISIKGTTISVTGSGLIQVDSGIIFSDTGSGNSISITADDLEIVG